MTDAAESERTVCQRPLDIVDVAAAQNLSGNRRVLGNNQLVGKFAAVDNVAFVNRERESCTDRRVSFSSDAESFAGCRDVLRQFNFVNLNQIVGRGRIFISRQIIFAALVNVMSRRVESRRGSGKSFASRESYILAGKANFRRESRRAAIEAVVAVRDNRVARRNFHAVINIVGGNFNVGSEFNGLDSPVVARVKVNRAGVIIFSDGSFNNADAFRHGDFENFRVAGRRLRAAVEIVTAEISRRLNNFSVFVNVVADDAAAQHDNILNGAALRNRSE